MAWPLWECVSPSTEGTQLGLETREARASDSQGGSEERRLGLCSWDGCRAGPGCVSSHPVGWWQDWDLRWIPKPLPDACGMFQPHTKALSTLPSLRGPSPASPAHLPGPCSTEGTCYSTTHTPPYQGGREHEAETAQRQVGVARLR